MDKAKFSSDKMYPILIEVILVECIIVGVHLEQDICTIERYVARLTI